MIEDINLPGNIAKVISDDEEIHLDETCNGDSSEDDNPHDHDDK